MMPEILDAIERNHHFTDMAIDNEAAFIKQMINDNTELLSILIVAGICITIILGAAILWNQRKIKKMLREMQENRKEDDGSI